MHLILTGATGLIGTAVINHVIKTGFASKTVTHLTILSRKPVPLASEANDPRITIIQHDDFGNYPASLLERLKGAEGCIWALGVSQYAVDGEEYVKITKDYAVAAAKAFAKLNGDQGFNFVFVSTDGATYNPGFFTPQFKQIKGETELALLEVAKIPQYAFLRLLVARPGGVNPFSDPICTNVCANQSLGRKRIIFRPSVFSLFKAVSPNMVIESGDLARCLIGLSTKKYGDNVKWDGDDVESEGKVLTNAALNRIIKEDLVP